MRLALMSLVVGFAFLVGFPTSAQPLECAPFETAERSLWLGYGERPIAMGELEKGLLMLFVSEDGASWTVVLVDELGACQKASGSNWQSIKWALPGKTP